ncbi:AbrB/MazE/SpoVT family DNA-binding domain-containing protein [Candidatus Woesearchaeota archaeon]|nr:AbrB/MazE/SpoVT family DNA-binding domain-containing protein [Candidatus Woesearchaeota archaeon]
MQGMNCACGKVAKYVKNLRFNNYDLDGWKCENCNETYFNPEKTEKILLLNKLKKHKFYLKLSRVKSNLILRIPKDVGDVLNLHNGDKVEFSLSKIDNITIKPLENSKKDYK